MNKQLNPLPVLKCHFSLQFYSFHRTIPIDINKHKNFTAQFTNPRIMRVVLLVRELYFEGFKNLGSYVVKHSLKTLTWFTFAMFMIVLYAFLYRIFTGFAFA